MSRPVKASEGHVLRMNGLCWFAFIGTIGLTANIGCEKCKASSKTKTQDQQREAMSD
jgi:hypothetical protein